MSGDPILAERHFEHMSDFLNFVERDAHPEMGNSSRTSSQSFAGTRSWKEAWDMATVGWPEGTKKMAALKDRISGVVGSYVKKLDYTYEVAGSVVDVGRFCSGEPECFMQFQDSVEEGKGGKLVHLLIRADALCDVTTQEIFMRGAAILALVDALEQAGMIAEITMACANQSNWSSGRTVYSVIAKRAGEALELDRMAFAIANASFFRRLMFSAMEQETPEIRQRMAVKEGGGYGRTWRDWDPGNRDIYMRDVRHGEPFWQSESAAVAWVLTKLKEQGVALEEGA